MAFGSPAQAVYKFDKATRILSLDSDFFSDFSVRYIKDFSKGRSISEGTKEINRLYAVETTMSLVGAKADHRLGVKPSEMVEIAKAVAGALGVSGASGTGLSDKATKWIEPMAKDLLDHKDKSLKSLARCLHYRIPLRQTTTRENPAELDELYARRKEYALNAGLDAESAVWRDAASDLPYSPYSPSSGRKGLRVRQRSGGLVDITEISPTIAALAQKQVVHRVYWVDTES